jgi:hypothetical protein
MRVFSNDFSVRITSGPLLPVPDVTAGQLLTDLALELDYCDFESQDNRAPVIWALGRLTPTDMGRSTRNMAEN